MCDFKPGDEVVHSRDQNPVLAGRYDFWLRIFNPGSPAVSISGVKTVIAVIPHPMLDGIWGLAFADHGTDLFPHFAYRKVVRRDLSAWLETAATDTDKWDRPVKTPARPKVDALPLFTDELLTEGDAVIVRGNRAEKAR